MFNISRNWRAFYPWKEGSSLGNMDGPLYGLFLRHPWANMCQIGYLNPLVWSDRIWGWQLRRSWKEFPSGGIPIPLFKLLSNFWLNIEWHICRGDTSAPRRKGQMAGWKERAAISAVEGEGETGPDIWVQKSYMDSVSTPMLHKRTLTQLKIKPLQIPSDKPIELCQESALINEWFQTQCL